VNKNVDEVKVWHVLVAIAMATPLGCICVIVMALLWKGG
jgi:hypothetical protein